MHGFVVIQQFSIHTKTLNFIFNSYTLEKIEASKSIALEAGQLLSKSSPVEVLVSIWT